jgi:sulfatase modifying factor 1
MRRCLLGALWLCLFAALAAGPARAATWALLIGINGYRTVAPLRYSVADVKAVRDLLVSQGGYAADHVITMTDESRGEEEPTNNNIVFQFGELARRIGAEDSFLFYFTGHGYELEGRHYLLSINADPRSVDTLEISAVSLERLRQQVRGLRARQVIFLVDACRNKPAAALGDEPNPLSAELAKSVQVVARASGAGAVGSAVVFSCSPGERAYEWAARGHSIFGYYLLEGLSGKAAEATGEVTVTGLAEYLQQEVPRAPRQVAGEEKQHPWLEAQGAARLVVARVAPAAPHAPETAVRELPTTATLRISSEPAGATVTVDGTASGTTPCEVTVPLGAAAEKRVTVTVEKEGSVARKAEVALYAGRVSAWEEVKLEPVPAPVRPVISPALPSTAAPPTQAVSGQVWVSPTDGAEMVYVPAGEFLMGSPEGEGDDSQRPQRRIYLDAYWIDRYPVTVVQYRRFCQATGREMPPPPGWGWQDNHPIVDVQWDDAAAYAAWAGKRLPTEAEWEKAARGTDGREFPWGNTWDPAKCASNGRSTEPVGSHPAGASPYGALDMAGNVWQWCADRYDRHRYASMPARNPRADSGEDHVLRGGSWDNRAGGPWHYRAACRPSAGAGDYRVGFRCARDAE